MNAIGSALATFLETAPVYGQQVYPVIVPKEAKYPTVSYMVLPGAGPLSTHEAYDPTERMFNRVRVQFSVRSIRYAEVESVSDDLIRRLHGFRGDMAGISVGSVLVIGWQDGPMEPDTKLLVRIIDAEIQYTSEVSS